MEHTTDDPAATGAPAQESCVEEFDAGHKLRDLGRGFRYTFGPDPPKERPSSGS